MSGELNENGQPETHSDITGLLPSNDNGNCEMELKTLRAVTPGYTGRHNFGTFPRESTSSENTDTMHSVNDQYIEELPNHHQEYKGQPPREIRRKFNFVVRLLGGFTAKGIGYVVCALFVACLLLCSILGLVLYFICYFGRDEHLFRFLSQVCYRPSFTIIELVVCCAMFKNYCDQPTPTDRSWTNVFNASLILTKIRMLRQSKRLRCSIGCIFVLCLLVVGVHIAFRSWFIKLTKKKCRTKVEKVWYFLDFTEPFFFWLFWCLICIQRVALKVSQQKVVEEICKPGPKNALSNSRYNECIEKVKLLFDTYYPLRNVIVSLMYLLLFNATFGMSVVLTWNYNKQSTTPLTTSTPITKGKVNRMCTYSCDTPEFMHDRKVFIVYNLFTFWRHLMTIVVPYICTSGLDIEHIWEDLRTDLYSKYPNCQNINTLESVTAYTEQFQSKKSYYRLVNILLPLLALFAAILSQRNSNFLE